MPAQFARRFSWTRDAQEALDAWVRKARRLGVNLEGQPGHGESDAAALRAALSHALACRCHEREQSPRKRDANPLAVLRKRARLTQYEAAALLGIHRSTLATYERHERTVTAALLAQAREAWGVST